ncbi:MAG: hypothetical protein LBB22_02835 [Treponema sp.]|jgi:hypothetical protein|nr:hypothetical protein [Treponema sp.]
MKIENARLYIALSVKKIKKFFINLSETSILSIWVAILLISAALIWGLTANLRSDITIKIVNQYLIGIGESRRIESAVSTWHIPGNISQLGMWYTMTSKENAIIFPLIMEGIFSPCLAIIDNDGRLSTLVPLTVNADRIMSRVNPGYLRICMDRIEKNAAVLRQIQQERNRLGG